VLFEESCFSFWVIFYVTFLDVNECSIPDICPANFECKNLKFTYKCECRGGFKYQIKEKGKSKECVGEFWRIILITLGKIICILLKKDCFLQQSLKREIESTIRGHRKKLSHRRDSKLRPYAVRKSNPKKVTLLARQRVLSTQWLEHGGSWVRIPSGVQIFSMPSYGWFFISPFPNLIISYQWDRLDCFSYQNS